MAIKAIRTAISEMTKAAHDLISGQKFFRRSASHKHSQCGAVPGVQPAVACASCGQDIPLNSLGYLSCTVEVSEDMLAACEKVSEEYRYTMSCGGVIRDSAMRHNLTPQAYLACFAVPELVAEIRRLRSTTNS